MSIVLIGFLLVHGLIHFMGFAKAFDYAQITPLTKTISKPVGILWLLAGLLFMISLGLVLTKKEGWPIPTMIAIILSQILIFTVWQDAKFGTLANTILMAVAIIGFATYHFENTFRKDVVSAIGKTTFYNERVTEKDLEPLPPVVQRYLRYVGVVGKPKVWNVKIVFEGEMRDKGQDWFQFTSEQYNFFNPPTRLFFMKAKVKGLPTHGYHEYKTEGAGMLVKILSLFSVIEMKGAEMIPTETVTFFNDLCLFAPAQLIDHRISWESIDDLSVKATFTTQRSTISAILSFNEKGQLINFVSNDRYSISEMKTYPFSTPASKYHNLGGFNLPTHGEAIWHYPYGEFIYGKFNLQDVQYNVYQPKH